MIVHERHMEEMHRENSEILKRSLNARQAQPH